MEESTSTSFIANSFIGRHLVEFVLAVGGILTPVIQNYWGFTELLIMWAMIFYLALTLIILKQRDEKIKLNASIENIREELMNKKRFEDTFTEKIFSENVLYAIDLNIKSTQTRGFTTNLDSSSVIDIFAFSDNKFNFALLDEENYILATGGDSNAPGNALLNYDNVSFIKHRMVLPHAGKWTFTFNTNSLGIKEDIRVNLIISLHERQFP